MVLGTKIYVTLPGPDSLTGNENPLDQREGVFLQNVAVLERAHLAFIGVADNIFCIAAGGAGALPLYAAGKAGPAPTPQPGSLYF